MLHHLLEAIVPTLIVILELIGVLIIALISIKAFFKYSLKHFDVSNDVIKIELEKAFSLGLTFLLGGEILSTIFIRSIEQIMIVGAIIALRVALTLLIHWEINADMNHCNSFSSLRERVSCRQDVLDQKNISKQKIN